MSVGKQHARGIGPSVQHGSRRCGTLHNTRIRSRHWPVDSILFQPQHTHQTGMFFSMYHPGWLLLLGLWSSNAARERLNRSWPLPQPAPPQPHGKQQEPVIHNDLGPRVIAAPLLVVTHAHQQSRSQGVYAISGYAPCGNASDTVWDDYYAAINTAIEPHATVLPTHHRHRRQFQHRKQQLHPRPRWYSWKQFSRASRHRSCQCSWPTFPHLHGT